MSSPAGFFFEPHTYFCNLTRFVFSLNHASTTSLFTVLSSIRKRVYGIAYWIGRPSTLDLESVTAIDQPNSEQMPDAKVMIGCKWLQSKAPVKLGQNE